MNRFAVAALLTVPIPATARPGQSYSINILQPSGTSDGAQNVVTITAAGTRLVTVTNLSYRVGDTSPGGWYNARDFGNGNLDNAHVNNAFAAASGIRVPFAFSDAFDAMDAFPEDTAGTAGGDGIPNWAEFRAGTDPNDAGSGLQLRAPGLINGGPRLRWPTATGKSYVLEVSTILAGTNWAAIATNIVGSGRDIEFQTPTTAGPRFYRVRLVEP